MAEETVEEVKTSEDEEDLDADVEEEDKKSDAEIPIRKTLVKTNADFARNRIAIKGNKESKDSDEEELTSQARNLIEAEVNKRLAPLTQDIETKLLVTNYLAVHPEDKKFEGRASKYLSVHPTLTVEDAFALAGRKPVVDADEKEKAEDKISRASMKGTTARPKEGEGIAKTKKDFEEVYRSVKRGETGQALKKLGV